MRSNLTFFGCVVLFLFAQKAKPQQYECVDQIKVHLVHIQCFSENSGKIQVLSQDADDAQFRLVSIDENKIVRDFSITNNFEFLPAGNFRLFYYSEEGYCYKDFELLQPQEMRVFNMDVIQRPVREKDNGVIVFEFSGGTPPYEIVLKSIDGEDKESIFKNNSGQVVFKNIKEGIFHISLTDSKQCVFLSSPLYVSSPDNFAFRFEKNKRTCREKAVFTLELSDLLPPVNIRVHFNGTPMFSKNFNDITEFVLSEEDDSDFTLTGVGMYEIEVKDRRNQIVKIPFNFEKLHCSLDVRSNKVEKPTLDNLSGGIIHMHILDGTSPFEIKCIDNFTKLMVFDGVHFARNQQVSGLQEGSYLLSVSDAVGRSFDTLIFVKNELPDPVRAKANFETQKKEFLNILYTCDCQKSSIEKMQKTIRYALAVAGMAGSIVSAGTGTLVGGIVTGLVSSGGMLSNELIPSKKLEQVTLYYLKLKEIEMLYRGFNMTNFDSSTWSTQIAMDYIALQKQITEQILLLPKDFTPVCNPKKLKSKYGVDL